MSTVHPAPAFEYRPPVPSLGVTGVFPFGSQEQPGTRILVVPATGKARALQALAAMASHEQRELAAIARRLGAADGG